jgi:aromatic-L-amino-acid/L-tryptophan decarboxylase
MPTRSAAPSGQLFPSHERRLSIEYTLTQDLAAARQRIETASVSPSHDIECFRRALAAIDLERSNDLGDIARWVIEQIETGVVHTTHPSYFGLFNPAPTFPSECADRIVAAFNPQLAVWSHAPACVEIETHTLKAVATRLGLGANAGGHFTSGGAEANFTALICALTSADDAFTAKGTRAFTGAPTFYASRESHLAWLKIAHQSGLGREAVRLVETDGLGRIDPARLKSAIDNDRNSGHVPIMVVATAGTTNAGAIDPLSACAEIARAEGLWLHVDAAWGGALIAAPRLRATLDGIELANSITLDAHKWFATTMGCGMFLVQEPSILSSAFQVTTGYMPSNLVAVDPYVSSIQWSRRFLGLRLFLSLAAAGWHGYAEHIEQAVSLTGLLSGELRARGWTIANSSPVAVLCFLPPDGSAPVNDIANRVVASGKAWISVAQYEHRPVLRACVTHGQSTKWHIHDLVEALEIARRPMA